MVPKDISNYLLNRSLAKDPRGWARREAEKAIHVIPDWVLERVVIDDEFMRLAENNADHRNKGSGVIWVNIPETKLVVPCWGEGER